ncbi:MAG: response regulator [bacterium]
MEENNSKAPYVLIVDDEVFIRALIRSALKGLRINILEAADGLEALRLLEDRGDDICVLITDHDMPGMTGDDLIAKMKEKFPKIKSLLTSGRLTQDDIDEMHGHSKPDTFLAKPFSMEVIKKLTFDLITAFIAGDDSK